MTGISSPPPSLVGARWEYEVFYEHPVPPDVSFPQEYLYIPLLGSTTLRVGGLTWAGSDFALKAYSGPLFGVDYLVMGNMLSSSSDPQFSPADITISMGASEGIVLFHDLNSLPASLADWELTLADRFQLTIQKYGGNGWRIAGDGFDTVTINIIPEPPLAGLTFAAGVASLARRRRKRP